MPLYQFLVNDLNCAHINWRVLQDLYIVLLAFTQTEDQDGSNSPYSHLEAWVYSKLDPVLSNDGINPEASL